MENLTAIPTTEGISILNTQLKERVTRFVLVGAHGYQDAAVDAVVASAGDADYTAVSPHVFYSGETETAYFDHNGVLTFECQIPFEEDLGHYMYALGLITHDNVLVTLVPTPKTAMITNVGGSLVVKVAVYGEAGQIVYKASDYVTPAELEDRLYVGMLPAIEAAGGLFGLTEKLIQKGVIGHE